MLLVGGFESPQRSGRPALRWAGRVCLGLLAAADMVGIGYLALRIAAR